MPLRRHAGRGQEVGVGLVLVAVRGIAGGLAEQAARLPAVEREVGRGGLQPTERVAGVGEGGGAVAGRVEFAANGGVGAKPERAVGQERGERVRFVTFVAGRRPASSCSAVVTAVSYPTTRPNRSSPVYWSPASPTPSPLRLA